MGTALSHKTLKSLGTDLLAEHLMGLCKQDVFLRLRILTRLAAQEQDAQKILELIGQACEHVDEMLPTSWADATTESHLAFLQDPHKNSLLLSVGGIYEDVCHVLVPLNPFLAYQRLRAMLTWYPALRSIYSYKHVGELAYKPLCVTLQKLAQQIYLSPDRLTTWLITILKTQPFDLTYLLVTDAGFRKLLTEDHIHSLKEAMYQLRRAMEKDPWSDAHAQLLYVEGRHITARELQNIWERALAPA